MEKRRKTAFHGDFARFRTHGSALSTLNTRAENNSMTQKTYMGRFWYLCEVENILSVLKISLDDRNRDIKRSSTYPTNKSLIFLESTTKMTFIPIGLVSEELILVENFAAHDCVDFHHFNTRSLTFRNFHTRISTQLSRTYVQHTIRKTRNLQTARNGEISCLRILTNAHYTQQFTTRTRFSVTNSLSRSIFRMIGHWQHTFRF